MNKKEYAKPVSQQVAVDASEVLAGSGTPTPQTMPSGTEEDGEAEAKNNGFFWEDWG